MFISLFVFIGDGGGESEFKNFLTLYMCDTLKNDEILHRKCEKKIESLIYLLFRIQFCNLNLIISESVVV